MSLVSLVQYVSEDQECLGRQPDGGGQSCGQLQQLTDFGRTGFGQELPQNLNWLLRLLGWLLRHLKLLGLLRVRACRV